MFHGFYNLTSGILCQNENLNVISNNISNTNTTGYKSQKLMTTTFKDEMLYRTGNKDKAHPVAIGRTNMVRIGDEVITDYTQGNYEMTEGVLDVALGGQGFFQVQTNAGVRYTRNGSFIIDDEGYLALPSLGRVLGTNGPIRLGTDDVQFDSQGNIYSKDGNTNYGRLALVDFEDYGQLQREDNGLYSGGGAQRAAGAQVVWKALESSNVNMIDDMVLMMSSQRALQSASQVIKMYDQLTAKAVNEVGKV